MEKQFCKKQNISDSTITNSTVLQSSGDINIHIVGDGAKKESLKHATSSILIIRILLIFVLVFLAIGILKGYRHHEYNAIMKKADAKLSGDKYEEALDLYQQAELKAITRSERAKSHCFQGDCYFIMGIIDSASDSANVSAEPLAESKLLKAVKIYHEIVSNENYAKTEYYYDAAAGLSNCYYYLNYSFEDTKWKKVISIMEIKENSIGETADYSLISQKAKLDYALGLYYSNMATDSVDNIYDYELIDKALIYLTGYIKCTKLIRSSHGISDYNFDIYCASQVGGIMINKAFTSENPLGIIDSVISLCEDTLQTIKESDCDVNPYSVFQLKYTLGKAYYYLSILSAANQKQNAREKSYTALVSIIKVQYEVPYADLENAGYYCVLTGKCTSININHILDNIKRIENHFENIGYQELNKDDISIMLNALSTCAFITICYDYEGDATNLGQEISEKMINQIDYMNQENEKSLRRYYEYFHGESPVPEFEKDVYDTLFSR